MAAERGGAYQSRRVRRHEGSLSSVIHARRATPSGATLLPRRCPCARGAMCPGAGPKSCIWVHCKYPTNMGHSILLHVVCSVSSECIRSLFLGDSDSSMTDVGHQLRAETDESGELLTESFVSIVVQSSSISGTACDADVLSNFMLSLESPSTCLAAKYTSVDVLHPWTFPQTRGLCIAESPREAAGPLVPYTP